MWTSTPSKRKSNIATVSVHIENTTRRFDAANPIFGVIRIDSKAAIPAHCIQISLEQQEKVKVFLLKYKEITDEFYYAKKPNFVFGGKMMVLNQIIHQFKDRILPSGESEYEFTFKIPPDLPQSLQIHDKNPLCKFSAKLRYFFKVQVVPIDSGLVCDGEGKSLIRARERVLISPIRPIVVDPRNIEMNKIIDKYGRKASY